MMLRLPRSAAKDGAPAPAPRSALGRPRGRFTQHRRLDKLRRLLGQHPKGLTLYELAEAIGVTPRSMRRYLKEVSHELDLEPVPTRGGGALRWRVRSGELPRKIELRRTQAYAILAARKLFEPMKGSTLYDEIEMATQSLLALAQRPGRGPNAGLADARLEHRFLYLPVAPKDYSAKTEELDDLFQAVADLRPLRCRYRAGSKESEETIVIHPYAMVLYKDAIYCVGLHTGRGEIRTFLLDRMRDTESSALERFELPPDFRVDDYFQGGFGIWRGRKKIKVVIDFDPSVADLVRSRRVHESQKLVLLPDGALRLTMTVGDTTELLSWVLGWGKKATVVEPPALVQDVEKELGEALSKYANAPTVRRSSGFRKAGGEPGGQRDGQRDGQREGGTDGGGEARGSAGDGSRDGLSEMSRHGKLGWQDGARTAEDRKERRRQR
jgi:predicted DNA-binding transcriptional regulator YafY